MFANSKRSAFSVLELIIVVAIIAILVAILVPVVSAVKRSARDATCAANMASWGTFLMTHAAANDGSLPRLAAGGDGLYDKSNLIVNFFEKYELPPEIAYSPSHSRMARAYGENDWISYDWIDIVPDFTGASARFVDNSSETEASGVPQTFTKDDEDLGGFATGSGTWEEYDEVNPDEAEGVKALYSDSDGASATWTFDLTATPGQGEMLLEAYVRKGLDRGTLRYDVVGRDIDAGNPQRSADISMAGAEESSWVPIGTFHVDGNGQRKVSVVGVGSGGGGGSTSATFVRTEATTQGDWKGVYGSNGYKIIDDSENLSCATVSFTGGTDLTWEDPTADTRGLEKGGSTDHIASCRYAATSLTIDVNITDDQPHEMSLYLLGWGTDTREQNIEIRDAATDAVLDGPRAVSGFMNGKWMTWSVSGHVKVVITRVAGSNCVISGVFFGGGTSATFVGTDATTQGDWKGTYGAGGYKIINDSENLPSATVSFTGGTDLTWADPTADTRGLEKGGSTDHIAACRYAATSLTIDVAITDGQTHEMSLYLLGWGVDTREQNIEIRDAATDAVLDGPRAVSGFMNGKWMRWSVSGHVKVVITKVAGSNCVISGVFFGEGTGGAGGTRVWADAVRLSGDWFGGGEEPTSGYHVLQGATTLWATSTDRYGSDYQYFSRSDPATRVAWYFTVPDEGEYSVYACWVGKSVQRVTDAKFTITGSTENTIVYADQTDEQNNGPATQEYTEAWRFLGETRFSPAMPGRVQLENTGGGTEYILCDAIAVARKAPTEFSRNVIGYLFLGHRDPLQGTVVPGGEFPLPSNVLEVDNPSGTAILVDFYAPESEPFTTHPNGVHILYVDGHVSWTAADHTRPRWKDDLGITFNW